MTISHHPSEETLLRFTAGLLPDGPSLVVAAHARNCPRCRGHLADFNVIGGLLLDAPAPPALDPAALDGILGRLDLPPPPTAEALAPPVHPGGMTLPPELAGWEVGRWRWLGPGLQWSRITAPGSARTVAMLLKGKAGQMLPRHTHRGTEYMLVLSGMLRDDRGTFVPGDLDEADDEVDHCPQVTGGGECVCLAAVDGDTRLHGFMGRALRPFVGF